MPNERIWHVLDEITKVCRGVDAVPGAYNGGYKLKEDLYEDIQESVSDIPSDVPPDMRSFFQKLKDIYLNNRQAADSKAAELKTKSAEELRKTILSIADKFHIPRQKILAREQMEESVLNEGWQSISKWFLRIFGGFHLVVAVLGMAAAFVATPLTLFGLSTVAAEELLILIFMSLLNTVPAVAGLKGAHAIQQLQNMEAGKPAPTNSTQGTFNKDVIQGTFHVPETIDPFSVDEHEPVAGVRVRRSKIDGLGVFAEKDFHAGELIGKAMREVGSKIERTQLGRYINHSDNPNTTFHEVMLPAGTVVLFAARYIDAGEEFTANYNDPKFLEFTKNYESSPSVSTLSEEDHIDATNLLLEGTKWVETFAKKNDKTVPEVESALKQAEEKLKSQGKKEGDKGFWAMKVAIAKNILGIKKKKAEKKQESHRIWDSDMLLEDIALPRWASFAGLSLDEYRGLETSRRKSGSWLKRNGFQNDYNAIYNKLENEFDEKYEKSRKDKKAEAKLRVEALRKVVKELSDFVKKNQKKQESLEERSEYGEKKDAIFQRYQDRIDDLENDKSEKNDVINRKYRAKRNAATSQSAKYTVDREHEKESTSNDEAFDARIDALVAQRNKEYEKLRKDMGIDYSGKKKQESLQYTEAKEELESIFGRKTEIDFHLNEMWYTQTKETEDLNGQLDSLRRWLKKHTEDSEYKEIVSRYNKMSTIFFDEFKTRKKEVDKGVDPGTNSQGSKLDASLNEIGYRFLREAVKFFQQEKEKLLRKMQEAK